MDNGAATGMVLSGGAVSAVERPRAEPPSLQGENAMTHLNRRQLLQSAGAGLATLALSPLYAVAADAVKAPASGGFSVAPLPYAYDALEPSIDALTMHIHHDKHYAAYVKNLNTALKDHPEFLKMDLVQVLKNVDKLPKDKQQTVINNGGGHSQPWIVLEVDGARRQGRPTVRRPGQGHRRTFGSLDKFKNKMNDVRHQPLRQRLGLAGSQQTASWRSSAPPTRTARS